MIIILENLCHKLPHYLAERIENANSEIKKNTGRELKWEYYE